MTQRPDRQQRMKIAEATLAFPRLTTTCGYETTTTMYLVMRIIQKRIALH